MPLLLALLVAAVVVYFAWRSFAPRPLSSSATVDRTNRALALLSNGQLFFRDAGGDLTQLDSAWVKEAMERRERSRQRHGWKEGTAFNIVAGGRNHRSFEPTDAPIVATCAAFERTGNLLYFLKDATIGGLFRRDAASGREFRLLLQPGLHLLDLSVSPDGTSIAAGKRHKDGVANIVMFDPEGNGLRELTGGDTVDSAPAWIPGVANRLLFQSSGLARDEHGYVVAQGPASIQKLDMQSGSVTPILDDPQFDHLKPRVSADGHLFYIRRPYEPPRYTTSNLALDTLLFPFRLLRAVFHYLNFFSLIYSRKPLTSASGPAMNADMKDVLLQGRRVQAEKALRSASLVHGVPSLVPDSWQLVRRSPSGTEDVLARCVASFDIGADGSVVYTNGRGVFAIEPDGATRLALTEAVVNDVAAAH